MSDGLRLRIVSWNVRKAVGLDWRRDPARVLAVLRTLAADIVLLQEADRRLPPRPPALPHGLVARAGWTALDADPATPSIGHHGNAVLLGPGLAAEHVEGIELPGLEPRGAVVARVAGRGGRVTVAGLHLGLRASDRRRQVLRAAEAAARAGGPLVLGGDVNEWRPDADALPCPDGWAWVVPGPSFHADLPRLALDRFLCGPGVAVRGSGVLARALARRASDHLPVWLDVTV